MALDHQYNVAIKLAAENAVSGVLAVISKDVLGLHGNVKELETGFSRWQPAIMGAAAAIAGIKLGDMVAHVVEAGSQLEHFKTQMLAATGDIGKVADATNTAWQETTRNLNTSVADNVKNIQHLTAVTGSFAEAQKMLHSFTVADAALSSVKDAGLRGQLSGGEGLENNTLNLARSLEQLGVTQDEGRLNSYLNGMTRAMIAMRGQVDGTKFFTAINNAGASRYGWNEEFVEQSLGPLIQSTQGRIGVQLYQLDRTFGQGVASSRMQAQNLEKYGLFSESDEEWEAGKFKGFRANSGFEPEVRRSNPAQWARDVREMMRGRGVNVDDEGAMGGVIAEIGRGNKNLGSALSELLLPQTFQALTKEQRNIAAVPQDAANILQTKDPTLAMDAFRKQWENLITALGSPLVTTATTALGGMATFLNTLATTAAAHPEAVKGIGVALVGVAAGLTALGTVLVGGAVVGAAGAAGVSIGIAAAITGLTAALTAAGAAIVAYKDQIVGFFDRLKEAIGGVLGVFGGGSAGKDLPSMQDRWRQMQGGYHPTAFGGLDGANDNLSPMAMAVRDGFLAAFQQLGAGGAAAGMGGGSGIVNAAYTTFGDSGTGGLGGSLPSIRYGRPHSYGPGLSTAGAGRGGDDPALTARARESWDFWKSKGLTDAAAAGLLGMEHGENNFYANGGMFGGWGDQGQAYGSFMWHKDRRARIFSGTGINVIGASHQKQLEAAYWEMQHGEAGAGFLDRLNRLSPAGAAALGVNGFERPLDRAGASRLRGKYAEGWYNKFHGQPAPTVGAPPKSDKPIVIHHNTHLDGEIVASNTSHHFARGMEFPSGMGVDTYGSWQGPATPLTDAA